MPRPSNIVPKTRKILCLEIGNKNKTIPINPNRNNA